MPPAVAQFGQCEVLLVVIFVPRGRKNQSSLWSGGDACTTDHPYPPITPPEATNRPGLNRESDGGARGSGFEELHMRAQRGVICLSLSVCVYIYFETCGVGSSTVANGRSPRLIT